MAPIPPPKKFDIDEQIDSLEMEIAEYTKKLFEAQGMLRLALHIKANCEIKVKEPDASSSPA